MFTHNDIWHAIDRLAKEKGYSASGLARKAGMDPTSFNKSKRMSADGKPRWPSTESISKILKVTGANMSELLGLNSNTLKSGEAIALQTKNGTLLTGSWIEERSDMIRITDSSGEEQKLERNDIDWIARIIVE